MSETVEEQFAKLADNAAEKLEGKPFGSATFTCNIHADGSRSVLIFQKMDDEDNDIRIAILVHDQIDALRSLMEQQFGPFKLE